MQLEDDFNGKVWFVLRKIKNYYCQNKSKSIIKYPIYFFPQYLLNFSSEEECNILRILEKRGILYILQRKIINCTCISVYLEIILPQFINIYQEYFKNRKRKTDFEIKEPYNPVNQRKEKATYVTSFLLRQELKILDIILKHYLRTEVIYHKDYRCLKAINRIIKTITYEATNKQAGGTAEKKNYRYKQTRNRHKGNYKFHKQYSKVQSSLDKNSKEIKETKGNKPLPITGKIEVHGLTEGLKDLKALRRNEVNTNSPKFPYKIPSGTHWNNVIIKFINEEEVEIQVKKLKLNTDFKEMGMIGKGKIPSPSEQWLFLKVLAKCNGEITIRDQEAKDKYKKQKQTLTEILQNYFSIDYDPFYPYKSGPEKGGNSYKIKLLLIPPPVINKIKEEENPDPLGIQEFLSSQIVNK